MTFQQITYLALGAALAIATFFGAMLIHEQNIVESCRLYGRTGDTLFHGELICEPVRSEHQ